MCVQDVCVCPRYVCVPDVGASQMCVCPRCVCIPDVCASQMCARPRCVCVRCWCVLDVGAFQMCVHHWCWCVLDVGASQMCVHQEVPLYIKRLFLWSHANQFSETRLEFPPFTPYFLMHAYHTYTRDCPSPQENSQPVIMNLCCCLCVGSKLTWQCTLSSAEWERN